MADFELAVIGAGAHGTAIARDAAGRGVSVLLLEQSDLGVGASFASDMAVRSMFGAPRLRSFLAWRTALAEREVMLRTAPHLVRPLRVLLPMQAGGRSALALRARLFACDRLARRRLLPAADTLDLVHNVFGTALWRQFHFGFAYSDCRLDETRLPVANARDAAERGAVVWTHTRCQRAERGAVWTLVLNARGERRRVTARILVNAAGPLAQEVARQALAMESPIALRPIKQTFIVVGRLFDHDGGYLLPERRGDQYVLALPFEDHLTLVGPVEQDYSGRVAAPTPTAEEIGALCAVSERHFRRPVRPDEAVPFARIRTAAALQGGQPSLHGPAQAMHFDEPPGLAPLVTIGGGPAMTARRLAEKAIDRLTLFFRGVPAWTATAPLPGGDFAHDGFDRLVQDAQRRWPFLDGAHARRLASSYGTRLDRIVGGAATANDLGRRFGRDLTEAEVRHLMREEWAQTADDVLCRRTKLGLDIPAQDRDALSRFMAGEACLAAPGRASGSAAVGPSPNTSG